MSRLVFFRAGGIEHMLVQVRRVVEPYPPICEHAVKRLGCQRQIGLSLRKILDRDPRILQRVKICSIRIE